MPRTLQPAMGTTCCCERSQRETAIEEPQAVLRSDEAQLGEVLCAAEELLAGLSMWQRNWCTPEVLRIYLHGRKGDVNAAAEILANTLKWREQYQDLLSGSRVPMWQGDFRVLTTAEDGHPLLYLCCRHQTHAFNVSDTLDHVAVVLETAVKSMPPLVQQMDVVVDCHSFTLRYNLDPRAVIGIAELLRQPYRDRLRTVMMVDAPAMIQPVWSIVQPLLPPATQRKFRFLEADEAEQAIEELQGAESAAILRHVMQGNRAAGQPPKPQVPSEIGIKGGSILQTPNSHMSLKSIDKDEEGHRCSTLAKPVGTYVQPTSRSLCHCRRRAGPK